MDFAKVRAEGHQYGYASSAIRAGVALDEAEALALSSQWDKEVAALRKRVEALEFGICYWTNDKGEANVPELRQLVAELL